MSKIEWTDKTINPWIGCTKVSPGCQNCYAERMAKRLKAMGVPQYQKIPILLQIPAAVRFVSVEPMLSVVHLDSIEETFGSECRICYSALKSMDGMDCLPNHEGTHIDWVICGAETGPSARPMHPDWARGLRDQSVEADVPFFYKKGSTGQHTLDSGLWEQYPKRSDK